MRAFLAVLLLTALALAGCTSDGDDQGGDATKTSSPSPSATQSGSSTSGTSTSASATATGTTGPAPNRAPAIGITLGNSTGLTVAFLLNGTDADGDALSWTLAFGDGTADATGTSLPANASHAYAAAGAYEAVFSVTDGKATTNATYPLNLTAGGSNVPPPVVFSGESAHYGPLGCGSGTPGFATYHDFDGELAGTWKFKATPATMVTEWWVGDETSTDLGAEGVIPDRHDNVAVCPAGTNGFAYPAEAYTLTLYHPDGPTPA